MKKSYSTLLIIGAVVATMTIAHATNYVAPRKASATAPEDVTSKIVNPNFDEDADGWIDGAETVNKRNGTWGANWYQTSQPGFEGAHLNVWAPGILEGRSYQTVQNLSPGVYKMTIAAWSNRTGDYVFLGNDSLNVSDPQTYTVMSYTDTDNIDLGMIHHDTDATWCGFDQVTLLYYGDGIDAYRMWLNDVKEAGPDTQAYSQKTVRTAYEDIVDKGNSATTKDEIIPVISQMKSAGQLLTESQEVYAGFKILLDSAKTVADNTSGEYANALQAYVKSCTVLDDGLLDAEGIDAEEKKLENLITNAVKYGRGKGADCTDYIVNADFSEGKGSTVTGWQTDPAVSTSGLNVGNQCSSVWQDNFDTYQMISGISNGIYKLEAHAFYRTGTPEEVYSDTGTDNVNAYLYLNSAKNKVKNIFGDYLTEAFSGSFQVPVLDSEGNDMFVPSNQVGAAYAFAQGKYNNEVYGIVTDGTMRIGVKAYGTVPVNSMTIFSNFRLTYEGKDAMLLKSMIDDKVAEANSLAESNQISSVCNEMVKAAVETAQNVSVDDGYDALLPVYSGLVAATDTAQASYDLRQELVTALNDMLMTLDEKSSLAQTEALEAAAVVATVIQGHIDANDYEDSDIAGMKKQMSDAILGLASKDCPLDVSQYLVNADLEDGLEGWTDAAGADYYVTKNWLSSVNKTGNTSFNGYYMDISGVAVNGRVYQVADVPNGQYQVTFYAFTNADDVFIYANEDSTKITSGVTTEDTFFNGCMYTASTYVSNGKIEVGMILHPTSYDFWSGFDNVTLTYYGKDPEKEAAGISTVSKSSISNDNIYNLSGVKVGTTDNISAGKLPKGVYIIKGRKVVIK